MQALKIVKERIAPLEAALSEYPDLWRVFSHCFLNTLETTVEQAKNDTFIITGDIHAMWLRDSTAQVMHYLRFADDESVCELILGLLERQAANILRDPYANAFNREPSSYKPYDDRPRASDWVWERKYEIDSLCNPVHLAWSYYEKTGKTDFLTENFHRMLKTIADVFETEQHHENSPYRFERSNCPASDTLSNGGTGAPVAFTGMTWSGFRPSDDACEYGYLIPSNLFAAQEMRHAAAFARMLKDEALQRKAETLACEIEEGIQKFALVNDPQFGDILSYETDGMGHYNLMDDANVPSLLALPYLGICKKDDPLYLRTRTFVLSERNPYYYAGAQAKGVGSPHTPRGYIWPIALCVQGMTTDDTGEQAMLLNALMRTHADCFCMHESFDPNDPHQFTREWFAWANSMFGEFIYRLHESGALREVLEKAKA